MSATRSSTCSKFRRRQGPGSGRVRRSGPSTPPEMLGEMARLAEGPLADSFVEGDRNPPVFHPDTHTVTIPEGFKKSVHAFIDGGWDKVGLVEELGGMPAQGAAVGPARARLGANPRCGCTPAAPVRADLLPPRHRGAAEVGRARRRTRLGARLWCSPSPTRAPMWAPAAPRRSKQDDGSWHIDGVKRFITSADSTTCSRTSCTWCWPARGRRAGHQGFVSVLRPEVPLRSRNR